jgi:hypothetical protein
MIIGIVFGIIVVIAVVIMLSVLWLRKCSRYDRWRENPDEDTGNDLEFVDKSLTTATQLKTSQDPLTNDQEMIGPWDSPQDRHPNLFRLILIDH